VDLKAAFDSVDRNALCRLWKAVRGIGVPSVLMNLIIDLHTATSARVRLAGRLSAPFMTTSGVRQGGMRSGACPVLPSNGFHHGASVGYDTFKLYHDIDIDTR